MDRHIINSVVCPFNCGEEEDIIHCLRDCAIAKQVWKDFVKENLWDDFFREANTVADWLANHAHSSLRGLHEFSSCPTGCLNHFEADLRGICYPRFVVT